MSDDPRRIDQLTAVAVALLAVTAVIVGGAGTAFAAGSDAGASTQAESAIFPGLGGWTGFDWPGWGGWGDWSLPDWGNDPGGDQPDPANLQAAIDSTNAPVTAGETLTVTATLDNTGGQQADQTVQFSVGGVQQSRDVSVAAGASTTVTFQWATSAGDAGTYDATVTTDNDTASTQVTVDQQQSTPDPANFAVSIASADASVTAGDVAQVTSNVHNTGGQQATQTVTLAVGGTTVDSQQVTLGADGTTTVDFQWSAPTQTDGTATDYTATVASDDGSVSTTITVQPQSSPAGFDVSITGTSSPVTAGGTLDVTADVTNTGGQQGTATVSLSAGGAQRDSQSVPLAGGASQTVTLSWQTAAGDAGDYTATVSAGGASDTASVTVTEQAAPANFGVSITGTTAPVTAGDALDVTAQVTNAGDQQGTQTVSLAVEGANADSQSVTLAGGASQSVTLSWQTGSGDAGSHSLTVASVNDSAQTTVTVNEPAAPANFAVSIDGTNGPVTEGDTLSVDATVTNTGDQSDTQTVTLSVGGSQRDSTQLSLTGGGSQSVTLSWSTSAGDAGDYTATVATENDSASTSVSVDTPATFAVSIAGTSSPVTEGDALSVDATVTNTGGSQGTQTVTLSAGGAQRDSQSVTLAGGASQSVTLSWQTSTGDAGDYTATVSAGGASDTASVTVQAATITPTAANGTVEDGYMQIGTGSSANKFNFTECPNGQPATPGEECGRVVASVDSQAGTYSVAPGDLDFNLSIYAAALDKNVTVVVTAPNGLSGDMDLQTGHMTLDGDLQITVPSLGDTCGTSANITATTGTDGGLTGTPLTVDGNTAEGTVVDNTFRVDSVSGCGWALNSAGDSQFGLPSPSGQNELVMQLYLKLKD
ncbi:MAG: beta strand repeat-containing protein [Haloarculaceae archaeon]